MQWIHAGMKWIREMFKSTIRVQLTKDFESKKIVDGKAEQSKYKLPEWILNIGCIQGMYFIKISLREPESTGWLLVPAEKRSDHFLKNVRYFMKYHIRKSLFSQISLSSFRSDKSDNSISGSMDLISLGEGGKMFLSRENSRDLINQSKFNKRSVKSNPDPRRLRFASFPESGMDSESQPANQRLELKKKFSYHM